MRAVIIGGGAAGLFAAGWLVRGGVDTVIIEHSGELGRKILVTGKGRCNVTNDCDEPEFMKNVRTNPKFMYSSIYSFSPRKTMEFFENLGVPLKTERGRRVFPVSDKAADIRRALIKWADRAEVIYDDAGSIETEDGRVTGVNCVSGRTVTADRVLLATGGLSYRKTGSTGDGYRFARRLGHTIIEPTASLVPLVENGTKGRRMMGLSLRNVNLTVTDGKKKVFSEQGEMLFTHFGISGPLVLSASSHLKGEELSRYKAVIDLKPALSEEQLDKRVQRDFEKFHLKQAANSLDLLLPAKMREVVLEDWGIDPAKPVNQITREERMKLVHVLKNFTLSLRSRYKIDVAVITSGGVSVKEVDPSTLSSKLVDGLYFAGEVIDVDAYTGGYNLQIAFSTAYSAARDIVKRSHEA